jgi:hypothetical protein
VTLVSFLWQSPEFQAHHNPVYSQDFINFDAAGNPVQCNMDNLVLVLPKIKDFYNDTRNCSLDLWIQKVDGFAINTGRFYSTSKVNTLTYADENMTVGMRVNIFNLTNDTEVVH